MSWYLAILYGIVQGLTEFLPVSSSGHLALLQNFFGGNPEGDVAFTVLLHLGTLAAVCIVYYKDVWQILRGFGTLVAKIFRGKLFAEKLTYGERLFVLLLIATLPLIPGAFLENYVEFFTGISWLVGVFLICNGVLLWFSDRMAEKRTKPVFGIAEAHPKHALMIGLCQLIGVLPGISRSGSTITGGLFAGLEKKQAVKFSFLLSIPAILGANILKAKDLFGTAMTSGSAVNYACGVFAALLSGLVAIKLLQYITRSKKLSVFSVYCIAVGVIAIVADLLIA